MQLPMEVQHAPQGVALAADDVPRTPGFTPTCTPAQHLFARSAGMLLTSVIGTAYLPACAHVHVLGWPSCCGDLLILASAGCLRGLCSLGCFRLMELCLLNWWWVVF
jgi:hypothetical protein